jgi:hypothetical protein
VDAFSQAPMKPSTKGMESNEPKKPKSSSAPGNANSYSIEFDDSLLLDCFLSHPSIEQIRFPLDDAWIHQHQFEDAQLQEMQ